LLVQGGSLRGGGGAGVMLNVSLERTREE
jgi:hypothetical protein